MESRFIGYSVPRMEAFVRNVLLVFAGLFPIVNPVGMAPIFASMTFPYSADIRRTMAMRIAINGMVLLVASIFIGSYILEFFGISIAAVQFGGGLVVTVSGWRILNSRTDVSERKTDAPRDTTEILSKAFYPLTLPLTVGPGSIAVAITLGSNGHSETHLQLILTSVAAVVGSVLIGLSIYLCYRYADKLEAFLGQTGTSILIRLSAFIVLCIGIQIMFNGLESFYREELHAQPAVSFVMPAIKMKSL
jgi:multiple antibiotic resistance protein